MTTIVERTGDVATTDGTRRRPSSFAMDLVATFVTVGLTSVSGLIVIRLVASGLGPDEFGAYSISRRLLSTVASIAMLGMGVAIPREMALATDEGMRDNLLLSGCVISLVPLCFGLLVGLLFEGAWSRQVFLDDAHVGLYRMSLALIVGHALFNLLYAYYRGTQRFSAANGWQLGSSAVLPILVALLIAPTKRADWVTGAMALSMAIALLPLGYHLQLALRRGRPLSGVLRAGRTLLRYGVPRILAGFAAASLFSVGPFLAPHFGGLREAGYLSAGQSILGVLEGGLAAFGIVALPKVSQMVGAGRHAEVGKAVQEMLAMVAHLGLFAGMQALIWAPFIVELVLGPQFAGAVPIMRMILLALVPYLAFALLRSVVDAVDERPINTINLLIAVAVTAAVGIVMALSGLGAQGLAAGTTFGVFLLGLLTAGFLHRRFAFSFDWSRLGFVFFVNLSLAALAVFAIRIVPWPTSLLPRFCVAGGIEVLLFVLYGYYLHASDASWVREFRTRAMSLIKR